MGVVWGKEWGREQAELRAVQRLIRERISAAAVHTKVLHLPFPGTPLEALQTCASFIGGIGSRICIGGPLVYGEVSQK